MAVAYQTFAYTTRNTNSPVSATKPSGTANTELLLAFCFATVGGSWTPPGGWNTESGATGSGYGWFWKIAGGSEPATYDFAFSAPALASMRVVIVRFSGTHQTSPIDASVATSGTGSNQVVSSINVTNPNGILFNFFGHVSSTAAVTEPSGTTSAFNDGTGIRKVGATESAPTGATGSRTWTNGTNGRLAALIAIRTASTAYDADASLTGTLSTTAGAVAGRVTDASLTGALSTTASLSKEAVVGASLTGILGVTATTRLNQDMVSTLIGQAYFTPQIRAEVLGDAVLTGTLSRDASGLRGLVGDSSLSGTGTFEADSERAAEESGSLTGTGTFIAGAGVGSSIAADGLTGVLSITADADVSGNPTANASLVGLLSVTAEASVNQGIDASLTGALSIDKVASVNSSIDASLTGVLEITDEASRAATMDAFLTGVLDVAAEGEVEDCVPDWPVDNPTRKVCGYVYDHESPEPGTVIPGAVVRLFRDWDNMWVQVTVTDAVGYYEFLRDADDPYAYHVTVQVDGPTQVHGISDRGIVPEPI